MTDEDFNPYLPGGPGSRLDAPADGPGLADFLPDVSGGFTATAGQPLEAATVRLMKRSSRRH